MRNIAKGEDGASFKGFVGCSHSGPSVTDHLSYPATREKGHNFEGSVGIPNRDDAVPQLARLNLLSESFNYDKTKPNSPHGAPILGIVSQGDIEFSQMGVFKAKEQNCHKTFEFCWCWFGGYRVSEKSECSDVSGNKREVCNRRLVGSVWSVRNKGVGCSPGVQGFRRDFNHLDSKKMSSEDVVIGSFSVSVKFLLDGCGPLWLSAIYGPNSPLIRKDFWVELLDLFGLTFPLWCVGGDFNVIRRRSEKLGGFRFTSSMRDFDGFIRECELHDPPLRNAYFTWSNMQESPVCKRLDRFLYSNEWELSFPQSLQEVLPRWTSDHWPIVLDNQSFQVGSNTFLERGVRGNNLREEIHWRQKAKVKWVKDGDCNSKLFHKVANGRRNRNFIKFLENERGLVLDNSESITEEILLYFKKLYLSPLGESWRVEGIDWSPISEESASRLDSPFSEVEIFNAIFRLDRDKASRPDGFTIAVFQDCWDVIKDDLVRVFAEFHNSGLLIKTPMPPFIVLLPKKSQSKKISDFRPISLIACLYKPMRLWTRKGRSEEEGVVFKIDFEKAYDHVKWDFLDHVLEKKGFSSKWRNWMRGCLLSISYAILVNDVLSRMLLKAKERSLLEGFKVGRNRCKVSHLQFADDTILFASSRNPTACGFWDPVIERISRRLDGWQRLTNLSVIPASMAAKVERMQRDFLWSGVGEGKRYHLVSWGVVFRARPFSWNFNFRCNLTDSEIEDLECLMPLSRLYEFIHFRFRCEILFVWKSQVPFKVKAFVWLVAHKKVNTNDLLQLRRPHKALSPDICKLCMEQGESADHLFLHCSVTLGLWHRLFQLAKMDWVPPKSISDMMFINYKGFGKSKRGLVLWQNACIALIWVVWRERNARIFEDKARNSENLWDSIHFLASFWAFCSAGFKGIPLNILQLDWLAVCSSNGTV
ncbi:Transposon TX1 uncharacterized 149 kDa protein [Vitis vinifera]|uniref:Transposon TX1 uncharacterized 149 kDa protein n=1 Tax=Vitis vinifera TaxID=29760 RepID=A0A438CSQ5_VITVI|nr:Transposon TX1 uncharacterized 149 kDa protein [Vitis vinifera]